MSTTMAVTTGWVDTVATSGTTGDFTTTQWCGIHGHGWCDCYPIRQWVYPYYYQPITVETHRPIKLTMTEVETLREAARLDKKLRETLRKFTHMIEVEVDFP